MRPPRGPASSSDDDVGAHVGVDGAEVVIGAGLAERVREPTTAFERRRSKDAVGRRDRVRLLVAVEPRDRRAGGDADGLRPELELLDLYRDRPRFDFSLGVSFRARADEG